MINNYIFNYLQFISKKNIVSVAIALIIGNLVTDIMNKIKDDIIIPISKLEFNKLYKNFSFNEYVGLTINFLLQTFIIYFIFGKFI
jgi:large-conductance mechanosensitive channel